MKLLFSYFYSLLILLLSTVYVRFLNGHQGMKTYQPIIIRFNFDSSYNDSHKYCCKLSPGHCDKLLDSTGFTSDSLKGRVQITKGDGWIKFEISNVQDQDAGNYRCLVTDVQHQIYQDYEVKLSEVSDDHIWPQPSITPTVKTSSATPPQSTGGVLGEDFTDNRRASWSLGLPFTITVSIAAMLLITSILSVIFCRFKARKLDKCVEILPDLPEQEAVQETSGIVYTTVDFRARQKRPKVRLNPRMHETQAQKGNCSKEHDGTVEYSVLACHQ